MEWDWKSLGETKTHKKFCLGNRVYNDHLEDQEENERKIKIDCKEKGYEDGRWVELAQGCIQWLILVLAALKFKSCYPWPVELVSYWVFKLVG